MSEPVAGTRRATLSRGGLLLAALVSAEVLLIAVLPFFPSSDGPEHLATGAVLSGWNGPSRALYALYFELSVFPAPNLTADLLLTALQSVLPAVLALKVLMAGYVIALPVALRYAVRAVDPAAGWLTVFALPLTFSWALSQGLVDFLYGLVMLLVVVGYAWRRGLQSGSMTLPQTAGLGVLLLVTYLSHLVPFVQALLFVVVSALVGTASAMRARDWPGVLRRLAPVAIAATPSVALTLVFTSSVRDLPWGEPIPLTRTIALLGTLLHAFYTFSPYEIVFSSLLSLTLFVLIVVALRSRTRWRTARRADVFVVLVLLDVVPFLALPDVVGGASDLHARLTVLIILSALLWLAGHSYPRRWAVAGTAAVLAVTIGLVGFRMPMLTHFSRQIAAWQALVPCVPTGSTMVQAALANDEPYGDMRVSPLRYAVGYVAAETGGVDLGNITNSLPFFLVHYRSETDPFVHLSGDGQFGLDTTPSQLDLVKYQQSTPARVDLVFVYGRDLAAPDVLASPNTQRLDAALATDYVRVASATPEGFVEVYLRRGAGDSAAVSACMAGRS